MRPRSARPVLLLLTVALALATLRAEADCTTCATAKVPNTPDGIHPYWGVQEVHVYVDDETRTFPASRISSSNIENALARWSGGCSSYPLPAFVLHKEAPIPPNRDLRTTLVIDYEPSIPAQETTPGSGEDEIAEAVGTTIRLFGECTNISGICDDQDRIIWNSDYGEQIIAHEIGHVLGLHHDKSKNEGCSSPSLMKAATSPSTPLGINDEQCALASNLNNANVACGTDALNQSIHPCQECQYSVGGDVSGLAQGENVVLKLVLTDSAFFTLAPVNGSGSFEFPSKVPNGHSYVVQIDSQNAPQKSCSVANGSGIVRDSDIGDVAVNCICLSTSNTTNEGSATAAATSSCDDPEPGVLLDPEPEVRVVLDTCTDFPILCSGSGTSAPGPWWWARNAPEIPCNQEPICVPILDCSGQLADGSPGCSEEVRCYDYCGGTPTTTSVFGPLLGTDGGSGPLPASGQLRVTGLARDRDGIQGMLFFLDGVKLAPMSFQHGLHRTDACQGSQGDCDPYSGFEAVFDTTGWSDGDHRLDVIAVDDAPGQPMGTRIHRTISVDNACAGTAPPAVSVTAPASGAVVAGPVTVTAAAFGEAGVERVQFYLDGARVSTDWTAPYTWTWDSTAVPDGAHTVTVRAVDECGARVDATPVTVETANANDPPHLDLEVPTVGIAVAGSAVEVSGWALDEDGIDSVALRLDGVPVPATGSTTRTRTDVCSAFGDLDPDCPEVGWALTFDSTAQPDGIYTLQVVATDRRGGQSVVSRQIEVRNDPPLPPTVTAPTSRTALLGGSVSFHVTANGTDPLLYRWQHRDGVRWVNLYGGTRIAGANTDTLTLDLLEYADAGGYRCVVTNGGGTTPSASASLAVVETLDAPTVTAGLDQSVTEGETATLRVSAEGIGPLTYRWQHLEGGAYVDLANGGGFSGARSDTLSLSGTTLADQGYYRCRVGNDGGTTPSEPIRLTVHADLDGTCVEGPNTVCLHQNRFRAEMVINGSAGKAHDYSDVGGLFTLNNPDNVEAAVKIIDGTGVNGRYWVFHGALTDLAYTLTVTDTVTGAERTYLKQFGSFCGTADTTAFSDPSGSTGTLLLGPFAATAASTASCTSSSTALCLLDSRFRVQVLRGGVAQRAVPATPLSGVFTFGSSANPEVVVKVLDGTPVNDWYWVFFGSLTDQAYEVVVTDTASGAEKRYPSPGASCGDADTTAF